MEHVPPHEGLDAEVSDRAVLRADPEAYREMKRQLHETLVEVRRDVSGSSPLLLAVSRKNIERCRVLLAARADPNTGSTYSFSRRSSPLHLAAEMGQNVIVRMLLDAQACTETEDRNCYTPLLTAASQGHAGIVKALLDKGACHTAEDQYTQSSMYIAAGAGFVNVLKRLIVTP